MIVAMLKPILVSFISQMKDEEVDKVIKIIKAIISYLEKEEGVKQNEEGKEVISYTR